MTFFALGYNEVLADSLWIRVIQDFDTCGKDGHKSSANVDGAHIVESQLHQRIGRCDSSWVFVMIDAITDLAPKFRAPYSDGGVILSVTVDDVVGAAKIYEKAIRRFPDDWILLYKAAYHFLYEMGDKQRAADLLIAAGKAGAPKWVSLLAARLYSKSGQAELGNAVINDFIARNPEMADDPHVKQRLAEIERDLHAQEGAPDSQTGAPPASGKAATPAQKSSTAATSGKAATPAAKH